MFIRCERDLLIENINAVLKAVSPKSNMAVLECIFLSAFDNVFSMIGNDSKIVIKTTDIDAEIVRDGCIALNAHMLSEIVRRLPEGVVSIDCDEKNMALIHCKKAEYKIVGLDGNEFPGLPDVDKTNSFTISAGLLKAIVRRTTFAVSSDETKGTMQGELLEIKDNEIHFVAVDGFRVAYNRVRTDFDGDEKIIIPPKALNEVTRLLNNEDEEIVIYYAENHVLFETEKFLLVSRIVAGDFLKYDHLFSATPRSIINLSRIDLISSLERVIIIASREIRKHPVKLSIVGEKLTITSNTETGNFIDEIEVELDGDDISISFNPRYLIDALKAIDSESVTLMFTTPLSPAVIKSKEEDGCLYLVLPLRAD